MDKYALQEVSSDYGFYDMWPQGEGPHRHLNSIGDILCMTIRTVRGTGEALRQISDETTRDVRLEKTEDPTV